MSELTQIRPHDPNPLLISQCEKMLADAKSGELQGVCGVVVYNSGNTSEFWVSAPADYHIKLVSDRMLGTFERIKFQLLCRRHDLDVEDTWRGDG